MRRGYHGTILLACLVGTCMLSAGCLSAVFGPAPGTPTPVPVPVTVAVPAPEGPVATLPAGEMALQPSDMPPDYLLRDRTTLAYAGIGQVFRDLGWRQGYAVAYYRLDREREDRTSLSQEIHVYPLETVSDVYSLEKEALLPADDDPSDYQVPFPRQGDRSVAWREIRTGDEGPIVTYTVIFTKKNVYEKISMTGTTTDYEVLKTLAQEAVAKIR